MLNNSSLSIRQWLIVGLVVAVALIQFVLARTVDATFVFNGLGYLALVIALYFVPPLAPYRPWIRWALIIYTAFTFAVYFMLRPPAFWFDTLGLFDQVIEAAIIALLLVDQ